MKTLLFNPNLFFSEKLKTEVSFKYPVLIMLVAFVNCHRFKLSNHEQN